MLVYLRPREIVVGLVEVTVVEPMVNVVLVVDENRQVATPLTLTGQLANGFRLAGSVLDVAPAGPGLNPTRRQTLMSGRVAASNIAQDDLRLAFRPPDVDR